MRFIVIFISLFLYGKSEHNIQERSDIIPANDNYVLIVSHKANYFKATEYCRFRNMHLVSIHCRKENDMLVNYIKTAGYANERFWTSGSDLAEKGLFYWMSTGHPINYRNFRSGEPNNHVHRKQGTEHCVEIVNYDGDHLWNDHLCDVEKYFVCERRNSNNASSTCINLS